MFWIVLGIIFILLCVIYHFHSKGQYKEFVIELNKKKEHIENELVNMGFQIDKRFYSPTFDYEFLFDTSNNRFALCEYRNDTFVVYDSSNFVEFQVLEDDKIVVSRKSGVGRAIVGGAIAGGAGAVIGALTAGEKSISYRNIDLKVVTKTKPDKNLLLAAYTNGVVTEHYKKAVEFASNVQESIVGLNI